MPILKKKITSDFTTVHNAFLRDKTMGLKERGMLITMLSMADGWRFSIRGLMSILPEGDHVVRTTLNNLEKHGYLRRVRKNGEGGKIEWEYHFSDEPDFLGDDIQLHSKKPCVENPHVVNPTVENPIVENPHGNKITNNQTTNNQIFNNQSINQSETPTTDIDGQTTLDEIDKIDHTKNKEFWIAYFSEHLELDCFTKSEQVNVINYIDSMSEVMISTAKTVRINSEDKPLETVKSVFMKLTHEHIEYVLLSMRKNPIAINNIRNYSLTALYNAPSTIDIYYEAAVNHDLHG